MGTRGLNGTFVFADAVAVHLLQTELTEAVKSRNEIPFGRRLFAES